MHCAILGRRRVQTSYSQTLTTEETALGFSLMLALSCLSKQNKRKTCSKNNDDNNNHHSQIHYQY